MPRYEYRCRACGDTFELNRPMAESSAPCTCPQGHDDTVKLLSTVSVGGLASGRATVLWRSLWRSRRRRRLLRRGLRLPLIPGASDETAKLSRVAQRSGTLA